MQIARWIAVAALVAPARAQTFSPWQALGPFDHPGGSNLSAPHTPESELKAHRANNNGPSLGAKHRGKLGADVTWKALRFQPDGPSPCDVGDIDLRRQMPVPEGVPSWSQDAAVYLYRRVEASEPIEWSTVWSGDGPCLVWLDGAVVLSAAPGKGFSRFQDVLRAQLETGVHHVLVKLLHGDQTEWRLRVSSWAAPSGAVVDEALERALDGLMQRQRVDGTWSHEPCSDGLLAGAVAWSLTELGVERELPLLELALESARARGFTSTEAAAWVALGLLRSKQELDRSRVSACLTYLLDAQTSTGLWAAASANRKPAGPVQMRATFHALFALDALRSAGFEIEPSVFSRALGGFEALQGESGRKLAAPEGVGLRAAADAEPSVAATLLGLTALGWIDRSARAELDPQRQRELDDRNLAARRWLERHASWGESAQRAREWNQVALCAFALVRARALGGLQTLDGFDVLERVTQEFIAHQRDDGLFQFGGARFCDEPLGLAVFAAARGPALSERRARRAALEYADLEIVGSGRIDVRLAIGNWAPKIEREFGERRLPVKTIEFFGVAASRTQDAVTLGRVGGGDLTLAEIAHAALDVAFPSRGRWQVRARVELEPDAGQREGRVLLSNWLTMRVDRPVTPEQLSEVREAGSWRLPPKSVDVDASSKFDGWPPAKAADGDVATAWACKDDDREPWIKLSLPKALKADGLRLIHAVPSGDGEQWPRASKVELTINGKERWTLALDPEPTSITMHEFGQTLAVRSIEIRVLEKFRPFASEFVGFSEVELIPARK